jgi:hypothetical protein
MLLFQRPVQQFQPHGHELLTSFSKKFLLALPLKPGIDTISLSLFSPSRPEFNFQYSGLFFNNRTTFFYIIKSRSLRKVRGMANNSILKIAKSVVPPPISIRATPAFFFLTQNCIR